MVPPAHGPAHHQPQATLEVGEGEQLMLENREITVKAASASFDTPIGLRSLAKKQECLNNPPNTDLRNVKLYLSVLSPCCREPFTSPAPVQGAARTSRQRVTFPREAVGQATGSASAAREKPKGTRQLCVHLR